MLLVTWHWELSPQEPGHGSRHLLLIQARLRGQSPFITHSGRQLGGAPVNPGRQLQLAWWLTFWHCELGPHGDGTHGFLWGLGSGIGVAVSKDWLIVIYFLTIFQNDITTILTLRFWKRLSGEVLFFVSEVPHSESVLLIHLYKVCIHVCIRSLHTGCNFEQIFTKLSWLISVRWTLTLYCQKTAVLHPLKTNEFSWFPRKRLFFGNTA